MASKSGDPLSDHNTGRSEHCTFTAVRLREGYAMRQVEAFVAQAVQSLNSPCPTVRPQDVRAVRFTPVRVRAGYDMREVDAFLDDLEEQLAARQQDPQYEQESYPPAVPGRRLGASQQWASRLKGVLLLVVVVLWAYAQVFTKN